MSKYRVLSFDGGGIKGIITVTLLQRLAAEAELGKWLKKADLIAGTSTGGLIALGLAAGVSLGRLAKLYEKRGKVIFKDTRIDDLLDLGKTVGADYNTDGLRDELDAVFGDTKLKDLDTKVLITAFDLDNEDPKPSRRSWKPKLFHNYPGPDSDGEMLARDVGLYTAAAPTYFPVVDGFIDGGVFAANPSMCALAQALDKGSNAASSLSEVVLLSFGTGTSLKYIEKKDADWGLLQWARPLIDLMLDGTAGIADYQCEQLLGKQYHRLAPLFPAGTRVDMDAVDKIPFMLNFANKVGIRSTTRWIRDYWS